MKLFELVSSLYDRKLKNECMLHLSRTMKPHSKTCVIHKMVLFSAVPINARQAAHWERSTSINPANPK